MPNYHLASVEDGCRLKQYRLGFYKYYLPSKNRLDSARSILSAKALSTIIFDPENRSHCIYLIQFTLFVIKKKYSSIIYDIVYKISSMQDHKV